MMNTSARHVAALSALLLAAVHAAAGAEPLKIGYINTLSGAIGPLGQDMLDGFQLKLDQSGGKLGGVPIELIKQDDQFKPDLAVQIAQKMIERDQVPIITGIASSTVMMAIQKPVTSAGVFLVGANAGPSTLAGAQCSPYQFVASWQNDGWAEAAGQYATDKGYKRMTIIATNYQAGKDAVQGFKRYYKGTIVDELYPSVSQPDFSAEITQAAAARPDAIFAFVPTGSVNFIRQFQQAGLMKTIPLVTVGMADGTTLTALGDSALGVTAVHVWGPDTDNPTSKAFESSFEAKYHRIPSNYAAQGYDSALLLDRAIGQVKGDLRDKEAFMAALKQGIPDSVRGKLAFDNNNFPINSWYAFNVAKDDKGRVSLKTVAAPLKNVRDSYHDKCPLK